MNSFPALLSSELGMVGSGSHSAPGPGGGSGRVAAPPSARRPEGVRVLRRPRADADPQRDTGRYAAGDGTGFTDDRSEEHTSELQSLMRISYAVFCLKNKLHLIKKMILLHT